jgi:hypothetical protein
MDYSSAIETTTDVSLFQDFVPSLSQVISELTGLFLWFTTLVELASGDTG